MTMANNYVLNLPVSALSRMYFKKSFLEESLIPEGKLFHNFEPLYESELLFQSVRGRGRSRSFHCLVSRSDCLVWNRAETEDGMHSGESRHWRTIFNAAMLCSILTSPCQLILLPARPTIRFANFIIFSIRLPCVKLQFPHTEIQKRTWGRTKAFISSTIVFVGMIWRRRLRRINNPMHLPVITSTCLF